MSVSHDDLQRAIAAAHVREAQGYFVRVAAGDQQAASLFVRLVADDLNPSGKTTDYGWLSKAPGETQVDGYAEDAICGGADPADLQNVVDLINGAGAPGATIGGAVKPRRPSNLWVAPKPLTVGELNYLLQGGVPIPPPSVISQPYPDEATWWSAYEADVAALYHQAGRVFPDNPAAFRWFSRCGYDIGAGLAKEAAAQKHLAELTLELGL